MKKIASVYFDNNVDSHLDHIIPLSFLLDIPVYFEDETIFNLAKKYYPQANIIFKQPLTLNFLANNFDALISCDTWFIEDKISIQSFNKNMELILCPHGNSDKGYIMKAKMEAYSMQDMVLLYGDHMITLLKTLKVFDKLNKYAVVGNYRLSFYKRFKEYYDKLADEIIFSKLNKNNKTILYAPTWKDQENSTSYFEIFKKMTKNFPKNYNLIVKPHPNLEIKNPVEFYQTYQENLPKNILFLEKFPLIYPLLNKCSIYLGDFSSIGYDFLYFQKPMFFIDHLHRNPQKDPSLFLYRCGNVIKENHWDDIFSFIEKNDNDNFKTTQKEIYNFTFGKEKKMSEIKKIILKNL